jgi:predicted aspartyl protease
MTYAYSALYEPAFPVIPVRLYNPETGESTDQLTALLDTGSDGTLVPIRFLQQILAPSLTETSIRSHWEEWRAVQLFIVDRAGRHEIPRSIRCWR